MARGTIIDLGTLKAWQIPVSQTDDAVLDRCLRAASQAIETQTSRRFAAFDVAAEIHSGASACGYGGIDAAALYLRYWPLISVTSLSEDGADLGVSLDGSAPGQPQTPCALVVKEDALILRATPRGTGSGYALVPWSDGQANVAVSYRAGYEPDDMPEDIAQACCELAWLLYTGKTRVGVTSASKGGKSAAFLAELTRPSRDAIQSAAMALRPCTALGA